MATPKELLLDALAAAKDMCAHVEATVDAEVQKALARTRPS